MGDAQRNGNGDDRDARLLHDLTQRAESASGDVARDEDVGDYDLVRRAMLDPANDPEAGLDTTLGGYLQKHERPPAFEGADGRPYSVAVEVERADAGWDAAGAADAAPAGDAQSAGDAGERYVAYLVFIRWADTGAGIMGHLDSGDVARGETEQAAREAALALTLHEVKAELDAALERRAREQRDAP